MGDEEKVGLGEVARLAGVSMATVSRVVNRKAGVSPRAREAVERAIRETGFERPASDGIVAVITPSLSGAVFAALAERISEALAPHGLRAVTCAALPGGVQERDFVRSLLRLGISGLVFLSASNTLEAADQETYQLLASHHVPFVCVNGRYDGRPSPAYSTDDAVAAEISVQHLYELGHRRIGLAAGPLGNKPADRRVDGFLRALERRGIDDPGGWVRRQGYSVEGGRSAAEYLLDRGATAVVAASDTMALGVVRAARERQWPVPARVSVVGYDDSSLMEFTDPPLTTVRQPVDRLAAEAARGLVALIAGGEVPAEELMFRPELVVRSTTAPCPADDPLDSRYMTR
ncbi:LacI family DNA-binding transcriptional regulator [Streptacidiphilus sp. EB129]|uniref:LacI family DNA-binding transcriptional regulator n=1 Tax=Streptacidiphilus sp. EB129 TaxID=3156262 RepID=UPI003514CDBF